MKWFWTSTATLQLLGVLCTLLVSVYGLYEDQIGKFDWKQSYVGKLKYAQFDTASAPKRVIVVTEENVVAALHFKTGELLWRQVLDRAPVHFLHVESEAITIQSQNPSGSYLVRGWDPLTGTLIWEWTLSLVRTVKAYHTNWLISHGRLYHVITTDGGLEVTSYTIRTGQNRGVSTRIPVQWAQNERCVVSGVFYLCVDGRQLYSVNLVSESNLVHTLPLVDLMQPSGVPFLTALTGPLPMVSVYETNESPKIISISEAGLSPLGIEVYDAQTSLLVVPIGEDHCLLQVTLSHTNRKLIISGNLLSGGAVNQMNELSSVMSWHDSWGQPEITVGTCTARRERGPACRLLVGTEDAGIIMMQSGKVLWTREEALAQVLSVEMVDLPVSDADLSIESEFNNNENTRDLGFSTDVLAMFTRRLSSQLTQLRTLLSPAATPDPKSRSDLVRDQFGLHKIIIVATAVGKVFGIDNRNGEIIWQRRLSNIKPFKGIGDSQYLPLFVQRTARHHPHPAQCTLLVRHAHSSETVLFSFNPLTGEGDLRVFDFQLQQAFLLPESDTEYLRPLLLLDNEQRVHIIPESGSEIAKRIAHQTFLFTADAENGVLIGYSLNDQLNAMQTWRLNLGGRLLTVSQKNPLEKVHSQGRVLSDRSVLFKYVNPNLVAVVTQDLRGAITVHLIDAVSGAVVFSVTHRRAREPFHLVHSENWLAYCYHNDKWRRTEIATLELYEGRTQADANEFSSLRAPRSPLVERQSYILPSVVSAMRETITEKGITSKHVLLALATGGLLEMPWTLLDPRRPAAAQPEEGVVPYVPELPVPSEALLNYNQTLVRIRGVHTTPSGLESTSLVLAYGLDLFYTRVAPSKTFDVLKDDFDYSLITLVLLGLTAATFVARSLAARKTLRQAWK